MSRRPQPLGEPYFVSLRVLRHASTMREAAPIGSAQRSHPRFNDCARLNPFGVLVKVERVGVCNSSQGKKKKATIPTIPLSNTKHWSSISKITLLLSGADGSGSHPDRVRLPTWVALERADGWSGSEEAKALSSPGEASDGPGGTCKAACAA